MGDLVVEQIHLMFMIVLVCCGEWYTMFPNARIKKNKRNASLDWLELTGFETKTKIKGYRLSKSRHTTGIPVETVSQKDLYSID